MPVSFLGFRFEVILVGGNSLMVYPGLMFPLKQDSSESCLGAVDTYYCWVRESSSVGGVLKYSSPLVPAITGSGQCSSCSGRWDRGVQSYCRVAQLRRP